MYIFFYQYFKTFIFQNRNITNWKIMYNVPMCLIVCQNVGYYNLIVLM